MESSQKRLPDILRSIQINADVQKVWRAVSTAEGLSNWLMPCTLKAEIGNAFTLKREPMGQWDGTIHCEVKELAPPYKIAFTWSGNGLEHYVSIQLRPGNDGTQVILVHSGWVEGTEHIRTAMYDGWGHILEGFKKSREAGDYPNEKSWTE